MTKPILLLKKYSRVIEHILLNSRDFRWMRHWSSFIIPQVYQLIRDGVSDMHCMSDVYLAEELKRCVKVLKKR